MPHRNLRKRKSYYILPIGRHSCQSRKVQVLLIGHAEMEIRIGLPALHLAKQGPIKGRTGEYGQMNVREGKCISHIHGNLQRVIPTFIMKRHPMYILIRIISATLVHERHLRTKRPFFILAQRNIRQTRYAETEAAPASYVSSTFWINEE